MGTILYSTGCPKCAVLKEKLDSKNITYNEICDIDEMVKKDITSVPVLEINGNLYNFSDAITFINKY